MLEIYLQKNYLTSFLKTVICLLFRQEVWERNREVTEKLEIGFSGLSIGSPFIACEEAHISEKYKQACVDYGKEDIVFTTKISGTPCTVINTPYVQTNRNYTKIGWKKF